MLRNGTTIFGMVRGLSALIAVALVFGGAGPASAQNESVCDVLDGAAWDLCNAYCEAMDCDSAEPQASEQACTRVLGKIEGALGETPFPTCEDVDDDGVPNGLDNCPDTANSDQADDNPTTPEGNACEPVTSSCPCDYSASGLAEIFIDGAGDEFCGESIHLIVGDQSDSMSTNEATLLSFSGVRECTRTATEVPISEFHEFLTQTEYDDCRADLLQTAICQETYP